MRTQRTRYETQIDSLSGIEGLERRIAMLGKDRKSKGAQEKLQKELDFMEERLAQFRMHLAIASKHQFLQVNHFLSLSFSSSRWEITVHAKFTLISNNCTFLFARKSQKSMFKIHPKALYDVETLL